MEKIMFNDKYVLTKAVLEGWKTNTRRVITTNLYNRVDWKAFEEGNYDCVITDGASTVTDIRDYAAYRIGDEVAIAKSYNDIYHIVSSDIRSVIDKIDHNNKGWSNKMFVRADLMPHRIKITDVRVERLQDISDDDCLKEGISKVDFAFKERGMFSFKYECEWFKQYRTPRDAFAALIDKTCGRGTWHSNPYVFVYEFELVK